MRWISVRTPRSGNRPDASTVDGGASRFGGPRPSDPRFAGPRHSRRRRAFGLPGVLGVVGASALVLAACSGDDGSDGGDGSAGTGDGGGSITLWTVYDTADRISTMEGVLEDFTEQTGIEVELVGVGAPDLTQAMVSSAAAGDLPDVVVHGVELAAGWVQEGILDPAAASEMIEELGTDTFSEGALDLVRVDRPDGEYATVPSDGWGQMIFYRTDLFDEAGLEPPETYEQALTAADALHGDGTIGFALGTAGGDGFTTQVFEHMALANDCQLVDDSGEITLESPQCVEAIQFYMDLAEYAPAGAGDVDTTRANYLAGQTAMVSWSPHLLDELAGLFPDTPLTCDECADDERWLVDRTDMVPLFLGPSGDEPTQYGITVNLGITSTADVEPSKELIRYLLNDGYMGFLSISPEGRFPMRTGTEAGDTTYVDGWTELAVGSGGNTVTVGELYGDEAVQTIADAATGFESWGIAQGQGELVTALRGELQLSNILREALDGSITPEEAAAQMAQHAEQVASELG
ncbi:ABC transporter substrate-binding protein [Phytoactinopolyspora halotolerans]|uniref:Extracellular solute-binding protein n=1 Tax=Phytoactinopolyspora halotolerans TaxID=1981512 RepID=A0A6L9SB83_9ACTN|nr:extracellular solute-binding protein [Phytoactinopolyspora halotolerans]NEE01260.1 extracellular solute-binding protein [Phytoactinopolyspora halotolerans]